MPGTLRLATNGRQYERPDEKAATAQSLAEGSRANAAHVAQRFLQSTEAGYQPEARSETYAKIDLKIRLRSFVENWELRSTRVMATKPPNKNPMARIPTRKLAANLKRELRQVLRQAMALKPLRKSQSGAGIQRSKIGVSRSQIAQPR